MRLPNSFRLFQRIVLVSCFSFHAPYSHSPLPYIETSEHYLGCRPWELFCLGLHVTLPVFFWRFTDLDGLEDGCGYSIHICKFI